MSPVSGSVFANHITVQNSLLHFAQNMRAISKRAFINVWLYIVEHINKSFCDGPICPLFYYVCQGKLSSHAIITQAMRANCT